MEEKLKLFWEVYDKYIETGDISLRGQLSDLLRLVERQSRCDQLLRPEKVWNKILAWQILRHQEFVFSDNYSLTVSAGEIIIWLPHWDRDVFVTRIPKKELVSGAFLKPGFHLTYDDRGEKSDHKWHDIVLHNGITDERGLYLPLYDSDVILKLCNNYIAEQRKLMLDHLAKEKGWV